MRQGEIASRKVAGPCAGGVSARALILRPGQLPTRRCVWISWRAAPVGWLRMSRVAHAQHMAEHLAAGARPPLSAVAQAVAARLPPLAADSHRRDPSWRDALTLVLDSVDAGSVPREALAVAERLCRYDADAIESMADAFLDGQVRSEDAGLALYVAAALQSTSHCLAASLASALRLLPQRNLSRCGSPPSAGLVTASGQTPRARYLYCSLCSTAWNHVRAVCITCGEARGLPCRASKAMLTSSKPKPALCQAYAKMLYQAKARTLIHSPMIWPHSASIFSLPRLALHATRPARCCLSAR